MTTLEARIVALENKIPKWSDRLTTDQRSMLDNQNFEQFISPCLSSKFDAFSGCVETYRNEALIAAGTVVYAIALMILQSSTECGQAVGLPNVLSTCASVAVLGTSGWLYLKVTSKGTSESALNMARRAHLVAVGIQSVLVIYQTISTFLTNLKRRSELIDLAKVDEEEEKKLYRKIPPPVAEKLAEMNAKYAKIVERFNCDSLIVVVMMMVVGVVMAILPVVKNVARHKGAFTLKAD